MVYWELNNAVLLHVRQSPLHAIRPFRLDIHQMGLLDLVDWTGPETGDHHIEDCTLRRGVIPCTWTLSLSARLFYPRHLQWSQFQIPTICFAIVLFGRLPLGLCSWPYLGLERELVESF
jgi:hypothetical protein